MMSTTVEISQPQISTCETRSGLTSRLQARASHQEAINILLPAEVTTILLRDTTTIYDPCLVRGFLTDLRGEPFPNRGVHLLSLFRGCNLARPYGPHRLVRDHDMTPIFGLLFHCVELMSNHRDRLLCLSLLQSLSDTQYYLKACIQGCLGLGSHKRVRLATNDPSLRMAD